MRIIAGSYKGRRVQLPRECRWLRPTSDRVREALFSILGQWVGEKEVLDLFSGTGLLGFEALSRGAARCRFVDQRSGAMIERMATSLGLGPERYKIYPQDVAAFLKRDRESADLILSDPPYDLTWLEGLVEDVLTVAILVLIPALAGAAGADYLCYVTPSEHLRLPSVEDVREGIMASRIAAHIADIAKGLPGALEMDVMMAGYRKAINWQGQISTAIDQEKAGRLLEKSATAKEEGCTMCGELCAIKLGKN